MPTPLERAQHAEPRNLERTMKAIVGLEAALARSGLERPLIELVKTRASRINGCAYCLDMHTKDARAGGESEQRLYLLAAWRETSLYSERERAALGWTEALTLVAAGYTVEPAYEAVRRANGVAAHRAND